MKISPWFWNTMAWYYILVWKSHQSNSGPKKRVVNWIRIPTTRACRSMEWSYFYQLHLFSSVFNGNVMGEYNMILDLSPSCYDIWVCLTMEYTTKMAILKQAMIRIYTRQYDICVSKQYPTKYVYEWTIRIALHLPARKCDIQYHELYWMNLITRSCLCIMWKYGGDEDMEPILKSDIGCVGSWNIQPKKVASLIGNDT